MTIDEAIEHAREKAEELKNEAINCQKDSCRRCETDCIECAEEHKQLAEWLEELKELRKCVKSSAFVDGYEKGRADERTDILNTIKNDLCDRLVEEQNNPYQDQSLCEGLYLAIKRCDWYLSNDKENDK